MNCSAQQNFVRSAAVILVMSALVHASNASSQPSPNAERPAVGTIALAHPGGAQRETLANGTSVIFLPFGRTPKTEVRVVLETSGDSPFNVRMRSLLPTLWRSGSRTLAGTMLADSLETFGASLAAGATDVNASISIDMLSRSLQRGIELLADIVRQPRLDSASFARALQVAQRQERANANTAGAISTFERLIGASSSPAHSADSNAMPTVTDFSAFYAQWIAPGRVTVYVSGQFDVAVARRLVARSFGAFRSTTTQRAGQTSRQTAAQPATEGARTAPGDSTGVVVINRPGARQATIVVGAAVAAPHDSSFARFRVVDAMLGGNLSSRISMNIREAKGYAYSPASRLVVASPMSAYWAEVVEVAATVAWPTVREIVREIAAVDTVPPTADEISSSARFVVGSALMRRASRNGWADEVEENRSLGKSWGNWDDELKAALNTSPAQARSLVHQYLPPQKLTVVIEADTVSLGLELNEIRSAIKAVRQSSTRN